MYHGYQRYHRPSGRFVPAEVVEARWRAESDRIRQDDEAKRLALRKRICGDSINEPTTDGSTPTT